MQYGFELVSRVVPKQGFLQPRKSIHRPEVHRSGFKTTATWRGRKHRRTIRAQTSPALLVFTKVIYQGHGSGIREIFVRHLTDQTIQARTLSRLPRKKYFMQRLKECRDSTTRKMMKWCGNAPKRANKSETTNRPHLSASPLYLTRRETRKTQGPN
jgi:hypothetical protein